MPDIESIENIKKLPLQEQCDNYLHFISKLAKQNSELREIIDKKREEEENQKYDKDIKIFSLRCELEKLKKSKAEDYLKATRCEDVDLLNTKPKEQQIVDLKVLLKREREKAKNKEDAYTKKYWGVADENIDLRREIGKLKPMCDSKIEQTYLELKDELKKKEKELINNEQQHVESIRSLNEEIKNNRIEICDLLAKIEDMKHN